MQKKGSTVVFWASMCTCSESVCSVYSSSNFRRSAGKYYLRHSPLYSYEICCPVVQKKKELLTLLSGASYWQHHYRKTSLLFYTRDSQLMKVISAHAFSSIALHVEDSRLKNVNGNISLSLSLNLERFFCKIYEHILKSKYLISLLIPVA